MSIFVVAVVLDVAVEAAVVVVLDVAVEAAVVVVLDVSVEAAVVVVLYVSVEILVVDVVLDVVVVADDGHVTRPNLDTILLSSKQSK